MLGERLKSEFDNLDFQALSRGIKDAISDKKLELDRTCNASVQPGIT
jgi:hypothetical protein